MKKCDWLASIDAGCSVNCITYLNINNKSLQRLSVSSPCLVKVKRKMSNLSILYRYLNDFLSDICDLNIAHHSSVDIQI